MQHAYPTQVVETMRGPDWADDMLDALTTLLKNDFPESIPFVFAIINDINIASSRGFNRVTIEFKDAAIRLNSTCILVAADGRQQTLKSYVIQCLRTAGHPLFADPVEQRTFGNVVTAVDHRILIDLSQTDARDRWQYLTNTAHTRASSGVDDSDADEDYFDATDDGEDGDDCAKRLVLPSTSVCGIPMHLVKKTAFVCGVLTIAVAVISVWPL